MKNMFDSYLEFPSNSLPAFASICLFLQIFVYVSQIFVHTKKIVPFGVCVCGVVK
jgi:hypothetical protein